MALNKVQLQTNIKSILDTLKSYDGETEGQTQQDAIDKFAQDLATAIDIFVKTGTVNTNVTVTSVSLVMPGSGVSGPGTGSGIGTIS